MKKTLALILAILMLAGTATTALAADAKTTNAVTAISDNGYLIDDDESSVDLTKSVDMAPYGKTIYFPLLSDGGTAVDTTRINNLTTWRASYYSTRTSSTYSGVSDAAITAAMSKDTSYYVTASSEDRAKKAVYDNAVDAINNNKFNVSTSQTDGDIYNGINSNLSGKTRSQIQAIVSQGAAFYTTIGEEPTKKKEYEAADGALSSHNFTPDSGADSDVYNGGGVLDKKTRGAIKYIKAQGTNYYKTETIDTDKKKIFDDAKAAITNNSFKMSGTNKDTDLCTISGYTSYTRAQMKTIKDTGPSYYMTASGTNATKKAEYDKAIILVSAAAFSKWKSAVDAFNSDFSTGHTVFTALSTFTSYITNHPISSTTTYVYDKVAAGNMSVSKKWEEGSSYIDGVTVERKKITADSQKLTKACGYKYLYFLAVKIERSTSTTSRDVLGNITIKQKSSSNYAKVDDIPYSLQIEVGYSSASDNNTEGEIPIEPATFKEGDGFEAESDYEFSFEADADCHFVVNTSGQGRIVLGMDTKYDEDIGDKYPNADLYFFNGNYATFNRLGKLYLGNDDDSLYVYYIDNRGAITRVDADYDDSEEAYTIKTRTLGRYVLSDTKLKVTASSSSSSGSQGSASTAVSAVTPVTPSTPSYVAPPVASSKPSASSKPASSSTASSEEPEESSEPESSEPEEEPKEEEDIVDVVIDDEENDGPEKKKGLSGWAWALIIIGVAAIPVAIGVVYYIQNRPIRRDFFEKDDDEDYDDEDDE